MFFILISLRKFSDKFVTTLDISDTAVNAGFQRSWKGRGHCKRPITKTWNLADCWWTRQKPKTRAHCACCWVENTNFPRPRCFPYIPPPSCYCAFTIAYVCPSIRRRITMVNIFMMTQTMPSLCWSVLICLNRTALFYNLVDKVSKCVKRTIWCTMSC